MAFRKKVDRVMRLGPDLLIVPECEDPNKFKFTYEYETQVPTCHIWVGDNRSKGIGVFGCGDIKLELHDAYSDDHTYVVPIKVSGTVEMTLIVVWAKNNRKDRKLRYIGGVYTALKHYHNIIKNPTIVAGDFNWNKIWDHSPQLAGNLDQTVGFLREKGVQSLYHKFNAENYGEEMRPTLYFRKDLSNGYHIDYIFASISLAQRLKKIEIGKPEDWLEHSDHMPLIATF